MKRLIPLLSLVLLLGITSVGLAGGGEECSKAHESAHKAAHAKASKAEHRCEKDAEECLHATAARYAKHGWLGVELDKDDEGTYTVTRVIDGSPAAAAGFRAGDVLVALNDIRLVAENHDALKKTKRSLSVGSEIRYTVERNGSERQLAATLAPVPEEVLARWVGQHMLEHHVEIELAQVN